MGGSEYDTDVVFGGDRSGECNGGARCRKCGRARHEALRRLRRRALVGGASRSRGPTYAAEGSFKISSVTDLHVPSGRLDLARPVSTGFGSPARMIADVSDALERSPEIASSSAVTMASAVGYSLDMIGDLPQRYRDATDATAGNAFLESFFVHVRLMAEFLVRPSSRDFSAGDFLWQAPDTEAAKRLRKRWWTLASQHVVHFSRKRIPADAETVEPRDVLADMRQAACDVIDVMEDFVGAIEEAQHEGATMLRLDLERARASITETEAQGES